MKASRLTYYFLFLVLTSILISGLSSLFTFPKGGIKIDNTYSLGVDKLASHKPEINWLPDDLKVQGKMNRFLRKELTQAYKDAWGILNLSLQHGEDLGLSENFSERKVEQLSRQFNAQDSIFRKDLVHNLKLHFISHDKQLLSLTDYDMIQETEVKYNGASSSFKDTSDYKIIMTLKDDKWRINKIIRVK